MPSCTTRISFASDSHLALLHFGLFLLHFPSTATLQHGVLRGDRHWPIYDPYLGSESSPSYIRLGSIIYSQKDCNYFTRSPR